ncbi:hypothetical protein pneo_cds_1035 [Pandoravirus neocaledonia]|uniref:Uncharacterized protein n=1 Tax=Pandoravirus neocaledonia TaxID=2107708 RepID=A0A2U7UE05_9VIRU|nr:hypothetical protein pneo_cds_1035 [Pandoravirus neocaledonia]AVK76642.1 hypothetical protein pneo_cds_1035 [Pandoravirus neocaledonia]
MEKALYERRCKILDEHRVRAIPWDGKQWPAGLDHCGVVRTRPEALQDLLWTRCEESTFYGEPRNGSRGWGGYLIEIGSQDSHTRAFVALPHSPMSGYRGNQNWDDGREKQDVHVFTEDAGGIDAVKALLPRLPETANWWPRKFTFAEIDAFMRAEIQRRFEAGANAD